MSNTFCVLPWVHQAIRNNGTIRICCHANQGPEKGLLKKDDGTYFNAGEGNLEEARNAKLLREVREKMLNNEWHSECVRCQREESSGMRSRRIYTNDLWSNYSFENASAVTKPDGYINTESTPVREYDLRFGNKCNLKCRSCGPTDSSGWYEDHLELWGPTYVDGQHLIRLSVDARGKVTPDKNIYDWYERDHFWQNLESQLPHITNIYMVGGEPLLIDEHYDFLQKCIEKNVSQQIEIEYNTNATVIPSKALDLWSKFKRVKLGVSIDGVGAVNDFIRHPSKWSIIEKNLEKLDNTPNNITVWLAHTVMALNIAQLPDLIKWRVSKNFKKINSGTLSPALTVHPLHAPDFLSAQVLKADTKHKISELFAQEKPKLYEAIENSNYDAQFKNELKAHASALLNQYEKFMYLKDHSLLYSKFHGHLTRLNKIRNQEVPAELNGFI